MFLTLCWTLGKGKHRGTKVGLRESVRLKDHHSIPAEGISVPRWKEMERCCCKLVNSTGSGRTRAPEILIMKQTRWKTGPPLRSSHIYLLFQKLAASRYLLCY